MRKPCSIVRPLVVASLALLLLPAPLAAKPACTGLNVATTVANSTEGQAIGSAQELSAALRRAEGGETFALAPGNYGRLAIKKVFAAPVTLRSARGDAPACFTELRMNGAENVVLDGLVFDHTYTDGDRDFANSFSILGSRDIQIANSVFDGGEHRGAGHGRGLRIRDSAVVEIRGSEFRNWWKALTAGDVRNLTIRGNDFHDIRSDGIAVGSIDGLTIAGNRLHNFRGIAGNKDHRDMVQILRSSGRRSTDIVIRDNIFDMGAGDYAQTIWMGGDGKDLGDPMLRHNHVVIENNVIYNAHAHGISVHGIDDLSIRRNTVVRVHRSEKGNVTIPRISVSPDSTYVVIEQNAAPGIRGYENQRDWAVLNNAIIQDTSPSGPGFYDKQFMYQATGPANGYNKYRVRPGSMMDRLNAGSTLSRGAPASQ